MVYAVFNSYKLPRLLSANTAMLLRTCEKHDRETFKQNFDPEKIEVPTSPAVFELNFPFISYTRKLGILLKTQKSKKMNYVKRSCGSSCLATKHR